MDFVGGEKGVVAVGTCKSRVIHSVTAMLRSGKAVFTMNSEGTLSHQKSGEGRWDGGAGQAEKQEVSILRTHTCYVERGSAWCSVLASCVASYSVALCGSFCGSKMSCLQSYACKYMSRRL